MKALSFAGKTLREMLREPLLLGVALGFPLLLLVIYHLGFGKPAGGMAEMLTVLVTNHDAAAADPSAGRQLTQAMQNEKFEGLPTFTVVETAHEAEARLALAEHKASAWVIIPQGFGAQITALSKDGEAPSARVLLQGDATSDMFEFTHALLDDVIRREVRRQTGRDKALATKLEFIEGTGTMSDFDIGVPGIIVFGILLTIVSAAMSMVRESKNGTLRRLKLTRAGALDILGGVTLAHALESLIQMPVILGVAVLLGFTMVGSFALALAVCFLLALTAIGFGLVVACFARSDGEAANLGSVALVPLAFLSGALFPMPESTLGTVGGRAISSYELLPSTHAVEALRQIMIHGQGASGISWQLGCLAVQAALVFGLGVLLFKHFRMRAD